MMYLVGFNHSDGCTYSYFNAKVIVEDKDEAEYLVLLLEEVQKRVDASPNLTPEKFEYRGVEIEVERGAWPGWEDYPHLPKI